MIIAIIGRTGILYKTALMLREAGHRIQAVITAEAAPEYDVNEHDFADFARSIGAEYLMTSNLDSPGISSMIAGCDLAVSMNWISVIQERHIAAFKYGILNIHAGDLPAYRGNACPNWAILNGADTITISAHFMEGNRLDCGNVVGQRRMAVDEDTYIADVYEWFNNVVPEMLVEAIGRLDADCNFSLKYADFDSPDAFRCWPRMPEDGFIDWSQPATVINRLIHASGKPFAGAYCYIVEQGQLRKLIINRSRLAGSAINDYAVPGQIMKNDPSTGESLVFCGSGEILAVSACCYEDSGDIFEPGKQWKSIRKRLSVRAEDMFFHLSSRC